MNNTLSESPVRQLHGATVTKSIQSEREFFAAELRSDLQMAACLLEGIAQTSYGPDRWQLVDRAFSRVNEALWWLDALEHAPTEAA